MPSWSGHIMILHVIFSLSLPLCCAYALLRGAAPERLIAGLFAFGTLATAITGLSEPVHGQTRIGVFAVDLALLIAVGAVALRANRITPLWITSMQLVTVLAHITNMIMPGYRPTAYVWSITVTSFLMTWLLALQTHFHVGRLGRFGSDRSWSVFDT